MRVSNYFIPTRKEIPKEAEVKSHQMMLRSGLIRQHAAGVYSILPLGWKTLMNIIKIVREEMDAIGCHEFLLPALSAGELWEKSGRWTTFGDDMFRLKDRKGRDLCLAPTHEEVFAEIASNDIRSYRDLPQMWYQIQTKFRDEVRPRSGLLRVRQFIMKDAYSLDSTKEGLDKSYDLQRGAYLRIFQRAGLDVIVVKASSGAMGGRDCEEFMVLSDAGDDQIVHCPACGYASNQEVSESFIEKMSGTESSIEKIPTPGKRTIEEVSGYLGLNPGLLVKSLVYIQKDGAPVFVLIRGDHQLDESKLEIAIGESRPAEPEEIKNITGAEIGFISPLGVKNVRIIADNWLEGMKGLISGANENDFHVKGIDISRDFKVDKFCNLRQVSSGDICIKCGKPIQVSRTIEVGHIFKLGTKYSETIGAFIVDEDGASKPIIMGSYGIGIERIMASAIEKYFDGNSMLWPREIAPFKVEILPLNVTHKESSDLAESVYKYLSDKKIPVLLDDRDERAGVKFKDADLLGAPVIAIIGEKNLKEGLVEFRVRDKNINEKISVESLAEKIEQELSIPL